MQHITRHPVRMNIHLCRNSLIRTAYASIFISSTFKHNTQRVLVSNGQSRLRGGRALWITSHPRLIDSCIKYASEPTVADLIRLQSRSQLSH
jgi:hypothetical protein